MTASTNVFTVSRFHHNAFLRKFRRCCCCGFVFQVGDKVRKASSSPHYYHQGCFEELLY